MNDAGPQPEIDPRKIRLGILMVSAVTIIALVLFAVVPDATARVVFAFVFLGGLVQAVRIRRRARSSSS